MRSSAAADGFERSSGPASCKLQLLLLLLLFSLQLVSGLAMPTGIATTGWSAPVLVNAVELDSVNGLDDNDIVDKADTLLRLLPAALGSQRPADWRRGRKGKQRGVRASGSARRGRPYG